MIDTSSDQQLVDTGYANCDFLNAGGTVDELMSTITEVIGVDDLNGPMDEDAAHATRTAAHEVASAVKNFCPQQVPALLEAS